MRRGRIKRSVIIAVAAMAAALGATAGATTFAVVPLVGRALTIVTAEPQTPSHGDRNRYETAPIADDVFDRVLLAAVEREVRARHADDSVVTMSVSAANVDATTAEGAAALIAAVAPHAIAAKADRMILVLPYRAPPMLEIRASHVGTGQVSGLGLYVNRFQPLCINGTKQCAYGFLGLFANFRIVVVDARTRAILAEDLASAGTTRAAARADNSNPLDALDNAQKIVVLQGFLRSEVHRILPGILAKSGG